MKLKFKETKGFTIIEALVSITVLLIVIIGPLSLVSNSINSITEQKDRITAINLAEEIIENFKAYRDNFVLACKDISIISSNGNISSGACNYAGANIVVNDTTLSSANYNPRKVAWILFLGKLDEQSFFEDDMYFNSDYNAFFSDIQDTLRYCGSLVLKLDDDLGYNCSFGDDSNFKRNIRLTKINDYLLKIEVEVVYTRPTSIFSRGKSIKITDYIYAR